MQQESLFPSTLETFLLGLKQRLVRGEAVTLSLRVRPGAKETAMREVLADASLRVHVRSVAEDGKANRELLALLADVFSVSVSCVEIVSGLASRRKVVRISCQ